jgi:hypothetical protein
VVVPIVDAPDTGPAPELPDLTGEDFVYIFIDTLAGDGYRGGIPISADYMIQIMGKNNKVQESKLFKFDGASSHDWDWLQERDLEVGLSSARMEVGIRYSDIDIDRTNDRFLVYFMSSDWLRSARDYSNVEGAIEGPTRGYVGEDTSREYDLKYHGKYDVHFAEETGEVLFEEKNGNFVSWSLPGELLWESADGETLSIASLDVDDLSIDPLGAYWEDIYPGVSVSCEYRFSENQLKENIILQEKIPNADLGNNNYLTLTMPMDYSQNLKIYIDGSEEDDGFTTTKDIDFYSGNRVIFTMQAPYAIDANGNMVDCEYVFTEGEENYILSLRTPSWWLENAEYPVMIDPTFETYFLETDDHLNTNDLFGFQVAVGDFNGDGYADVLSGAIQNDQDYTDGGRGYIFYGPFTSDDNTADVILAFAGGNFENRGWYVGVGDFNNDGNDDAVIGGPNVNVTIKYGSSSLSGTYTSPDVDVPPVESFSRFGIAIGSGNFSGDSNDDLVIGAPDSSGGNGKVWIYYYDSADWGDGVVDDSPDDELQGSDDTSFAQFGYSLAIGNFYSGPLDDIVVGEPYYDEGGFILIGRVNIFDGDAIDDNSANFDTADNIIDNPRGSNGADDQFGLSVAAGDFNPDGTTSDFDDIIVGEPYNDEDFGGQILGRAYVFICDDDSSGWLTDNPPPIDIPNPDGGNTDDDQFGTSVGAGDVYGDGVIDFYIGAPYSDNAGTDNGALYVYDCDGITIPTTYLNVTNGTQNGERLGYYVTGGRYENDSNYILAVGAPYWDDISPARTNAGRIWVLRLSEQASSLQNPSF